MDEVAGSTPVGSTSSLVSLRALGGFVAGEGTFVSTPLRAGYREGALRRRFVVQATRDLVDVVVPFMDAHLPESYKRVQYLEWRTALLEYWDQGFRRRKPCSVDDCDAPAKAYGYCRKHLWQFRRE